MSQTSYPGSPSLEQRYPFAPIRGNRISRMEETRLGRFTLDHATVQQLATENIGVFVGNSGKLNKIIERVHSLATFSFPGTWIAVAATASMAVVIYNQQASRQGLRERKNAPRYWTHENVVFTTPEGLGTYIKMRKPDDHIAGVLLIDTLCHVHKARGFHRSGWASNDRPQRLANFRADVAADGWLPPFLLFTEKPAKSINTRAMLSPYCLSTWWFVDGKSLRVGEPPTCRKDCHEENSDA
jgi:hypothetical protein